MKKKRAFPPLHPGQLLRDTLEELGVSQYRFARITGIAPSALCGLCAGKRRLTAENALRIARALNTDAQSWINLQTHYDLRLAEENAAEDIDRISAIAEAAAIPA